MISRGDALALLRSYVSNDRNLKHCLAVEAIMRALARELGEDEGLWGLVGLLHDIDYEIVGKDLSRHGLVAAEVLKDLLPPEALDAIKAHNELTGYQSNSKLAYALKASDHISGLIVATALVMPHKKLEEVSVESVLKKFKQKDFARGVRRDRILYCGELGLTLERFTEIALNALKWIHEDLGL